MSALPACNEDKSISTQRRALLNLGLWRRRMIGGARKEENAVGANNAGRDERVLMEREAAKAT